MKKLLLFLVIFVSTFSQVKSQTSVYHPFPDSNAVWNFNYTLYCFTDGGSTYENYSILMSGDTVINSQTYHKLNTPYVEAVVSSTCGTNTSTGYKGAIRQDIANKKVFYIYPSDSIEQLLYDFNLQIGDSIIGFLASLTFPADTVESIDSVIVGVDYRKRWKINSFYPFYIIEGIGSTYGLVENYPSFTDMPYYYLICFKQNEQALYPDTTIYCDVILTVQQNPPNNFSISISPNPFRASAQLIIKGNPKIKNAELKIYNALGECISSKIMNGESAIIERENLPGGIYFYQLLNDKIAGSGKFVIE
jgi:hypothetical protein